jgi:DNA polymerase type B, organellar and viral
MPIGVPTYFNGDIRKIDENAFGFFYCKIKAPDDILHPILQTHVKTKNGTRTISPIGTWEDMIFSEELINAEKYGYTFEILWGYTFKSEVIFKSYVDFLYNLRNQYDKSNPLNFIAKILLNSLYGRFGMDDNFSEINVIHKDYYPDFENKFIDQITDKIKLDDHIIVFFISPEEVREDHNVSVGIAAAITAYSRIHMSLFKNNPNLRLFYSDTDSIYTDSDIDKSFINSKILGKLKLEDICKRAIFLAAKLYCLETESNKLIIKVKGLKDTTTLNYNDFENLLNKNFIIEKSHEKWTRSLSDSKISILDQIYSIKVTDNKRELIYYHNKLISTKSYKIDRNKIINSLPPLIYF